MPFMSNGCNFQDIASQAGNENERAHDDAARIGNFPPLGHFGKIGERLSQLFEAKKDIAAAGFCSATSLI